MQTWVSSGGSEVLSHTLTRHMEILQDLTQVPAVSYSSFIIKKNFMHRQLDFNSDTVIRLPL
jgi:hypothetical protein